MRINSLLDDIEDRMNQIHSTISCYLTLLIEQNSSADIKIINPYGKHRLDKQRYSLTGELISEPVPIMVIEIIMTEAERKVLKAVHEPAMLPDNEMRDITVQFAFEHKPNQRLRLFAYGHTPKIYVDGGEETICGRKGWPEYNVRTVSSTLIGKLIREYLCRFEKHLTIPDKLCSSCEDWESIEVDEHKPRPKLLWNPE